MRQRVPPDLYETNALALLFKKNASKGKQRSKRKRSRDGEAGGSESSNGRTTAANKTNSNSSSFSVHHRRAAPSEERVAVQKTEKDAAIIALQPPTTSASLLSASQKLLPCETSTVFLDALATSVAARTATAACLTITTMLDEKGCGPRGGGCCGMTVRSAALTLLHCSPKHQGLAWYALGLTMNDSEALRFPILPRHHSCDGGGDDSPAAAAAAAAAAPSLLLRKVDCYRRAASSKPSLLLDRSGLNFRMAALGPPGDARHTALKLAMRAACLRTQCWASDDLLCAFDTMDADQLTVLTAIDAMHHEPTKALPFEFLSEHMRHAGISEVRWSANMPWWRTETETTAVSSQPADNKSNQVLLPERLRFQRTLTLEDCLVHATLRGGAASNAVAYYHLRNTSCETHAKRGGHREGDHGRDGQSPSSTVLPSDGKVSHSLPSTNEVLRTCLQHHPDDYDVLGLLATSMAPGETVEVFGGAVLLDKRSALLTALVRGAVPATAAYAALPAAWGDSSCAPTLNFIASRSAAILAVHLADLLGVQESVQLDQTHRYGPTHLLALATMQIRHADVFVMLAMKLPDPVASTVVDVPGRGAMGHMALLACAASLLKPNEADAHVNLSRALCSTRSDAIGLSSSGADGVVLTPRSLLLKALEIDADCAGAIHDLAVGTPVPGDHHHTDEGGSGGESVDVLATIVPELGLSIQEAVAKSFAIMQANGTWDNRIVASAKMLLPAQSAVKR